MGQGQDHGLNYCGRSDLNQYIIQMAHVCECDIQICCPEVEMSTRGRRPSVTFQTRDPRSRSKIGWKQTDGWTDGGDCITSLMRSIIIK